jgi:hypothetical protein
MRCTDRNFQFEKITRSGNPFFSLHSSFFIVSKRFPRKEGRMKSEEGRI